MMMKLMMRNLEPVGPGKQSPVRRADEAWSLFSFPKLNPDDDDHYNDDDDEEEDANLSLLLMMYFSAAVSSPASFGSIVTRSSI